MITDTEAYTVRILVPSDWEVYRALWWRAKKNAPDAYYYHPEREEQLYGQEQVWRDCCTEIAGRQCGFGGFYHNDPVAMVRIIPGNGNRPYRHEAVLSRLYVVPAHRGEITKRLFDKAKDWAARQRNYSEIYAGARMDNLPACNVLRNNSFKETSRETIPWPPAGGRKVRQVWFTHFLRK